MRESGFHRDAASPAADVGIPGEIPGLVATDGAPAPGQPARRQLWGFVAAIFLLAAVPRLGVVWSGVVFLAPDTGTYTLPAKNLVAGRGYVDDGGRPYSWRPPTYPLFLAAVFGVAGDSIRSVQVVQALLAAAGAAALALWMAKRRGLQAGAATGILLALDPILIPVPAFVLSEAMGTLLVIGVVICLDRGLVTGRSSLLFLAGVLGGAAALNTPITLLLIPWLLLTAWVVGSSRGPTWRAWALALGLALACVGAWTARNYIVKGDAVVVRENGFGSLVWGTTEYDFDWLPSPYEPGWAGFLKKQNAIAAGHTDSAAHTVFLQAAWRNFRSHPVLVLKRVAKATFWFWVEVPGAYVMGSLRAARWLVLGFHQLQLLAFAVALWSLGRAGRLRHWALWISTIVYFALFLSVMLPIPRYYVPVLPVMDALIAAGFTLLAVAFPAQTHQTRPSRAG